MTLTYTEAQPSEFAVITEPRSKDQQKHRILVAVGIDGNDLPLVDEDTLFRYYEYLSEKLTMPFSAHYPEPLNSLDEAQYECTAQGLLDPSKYVGDPFDGILCKTMKAGIEVNLPLHELHIAHDSPNLQLVEDYWYWFWNWRGW